MKTILKIGYHHYLLPAGANVNALLAVLGKATPCESKWIHDHDTYRVTDVEQSPDLEIKIVPEKHVIFVEKPKRKAITEQASPDAHNTFGS